MYKGEHMDFAFDYNMFRLMFNMVFFIIIGMFVFIIVKNIKTWNQNNHSPRLDVEAEVVSKRTDVSFNNHMGGNTSMVLPGPTIYYAAFQVESGDRMEFKISGTEYGKLAIKDRGKLSFQGSRFLSFSRYF